MNKELSSSSAAIIVLKRQLKARPGLIMWALGIISLVLLNILFAASSEPTKDHARHPILSRAAKALKKATRSTGNTLIDTKNVNRYNISSPSVKDLHKLLLTVLFALILIYFTYTGEQRVRSLRIWIEDHH